MKYYTGNNIDVTKPIEKGATFLVHGTDWEAEKQAKEVAKKFNSYHFEVYQTKGNKRVHVGYGIPK